MHQAGAVLGGDVVGEDDEVRALLGQVRLGELDQLERPLVVHVLPVAARCVRAEHLGVLAEDGGHQRLGDHQRAVVGTGARATT